MPDTTPTLKTTCLVGCIGSSKSSLLIAAPLQNHTDILVTPNDKSTGTELAPFIDRLVGAGQFPPRTLLSTPLQFDVWVEGRQNTVRCYDDGGEEAETIHQIPENSVYLEHLSHCDLIIVLIDPVQPRTGPRRYAPFSKSASLLGPPPETHPREQTLHRGPLPLQPPR